jgi:hypothetical protein
MNQLFFKRTQGNPVSQVLGSSPWTYENTSASLQVMTVSNGALVTIEIDVGLGFVLQVAIAGIFLLFPTQKMRISFVVTPPAVTVTQL